MALINLWSLSCVHCGDLSESAATSDAAYALADEAGWDWGERIIAPGKTVRGNETCPVCRLARMAGPRAVAS